MEFKLTSELLALLKKLLKYLSLSIFQLTSFIIYGWFKWTFYIQYVRYQKR